MSDSQVTEVLIEVRDVLREVRVLVERLEAANNKPAIKHKRWYHYLFRSN